MSDEAAPALKEIFNAARFRRIAAMLADIEPGFDRKQFLQLATTGLEPLSLLQRLRHGTVALRATLPQDYPTALAVLRKLAPRIDENFAGLMLPDFVGVYGHDHFNESMDALHFLTRYSSGEFAIREFLRRDLHRTLAVMHQWAGDGNEHVRRLASEGSRPRLPWSFRLEALVADPAPTVPILEQLKADPSLYVRKSVANHLNDISKDHPEWLLDRIRPWDQAQPTTAWILKRGLRSLIKAGDPRALRVFNFTPRPAVHLKNFRLTPAKLRLGQVLEFGFALESTSARTQRLVVDYAIHYMKKSGTTAPKVFKLREVTLAPHTTLELSRRQRLRDFTTRKHHPGRHRVEILVNGRSMGGGSFVLHT
jgi:3-methyladenine DNA glycosylase AlkC